MAPEVLRNNYYGVEVDLWAVGIILFELKKKFNPFGDKCKKDEIIYNIKKNCNIPE